MTHVTVSHPDDTHEMPIYDGPHAEAWKSLEPGVYRATDLDGNPGDLIVEPATVTPDDLNEPASATFVPDSKQTVHKAGGTIAAAALGIVLALAGCATGKAAVPASDTHPTVQCETAESGPEFAGEPCLWDAAKQGDGEGRSFYRDMTGRVYYLDPAEG